MNTVLCRLLLGMLLVLSGCAGLERYLPADAPKLSVTEERELGGQVAERLLQLLGGPYYDEELARDVNRLSQSHADGRRQKVSVADKSTRGLYVLPGQQIIMTRGLLADLSSIAEFNRLLTYAALRTQDAFEGRATRQTRADINVLREGRESLYDPDSASIRLARFFAERACEGQCLEAVRKPSGMSSERTKRLPESMLRLKGLQQGFVMLAQAHREEQAGERSSAIATYLQAAATTPDEPRILGSLGMAYLRTGDLQSARLHLQKAVSLQSDYYRTLMGLGYLYLQQEKVARANEKLAASVALLPVTENLFLLAESMERGSDLVGARSLYQLVVESDRSSKLGRTAASRLKQITGAQ